MTVVFWVDDKPPPRLSIDAAGTGTTAIALSASAD